MPYYEVIHSYPLTNPQKTQIAQSITHLHSTAFLVPSVFVHVTFIHQNLKTVESNESSHTYFLAGKPQTESTNRILGMVRTSSGRTKADWDLLAEKIEASWYEALDSKVGTSSAGTNGVGGGSTKRDEEEKEKKLLLVAFHGMVAAREDGHAIPLAGEEPAWYQEVKPDYERAAAAGSETAKGMLEEIQIRKDLKEAYRA